MQFSVSNKQNHYIGIPTSVTYKVYYTPEAISDIWEIAVWIAQ